MFHLHPLFFAFFDRFLDLLKVFVDLKVQLEGFLVPELRFALNHLEQLLCILLLGFIAHHVLFLLFFDLQLNYA